MENWLVLGIGQSKCKMSLGHLALPENEVWKKKRNNSLAVKWLGLCALTVKGRGSIPGQGTKIPQAAQHIQERKKNADVSKEHRS